ncbi:DUF262 domain-containing protein [Cellulomonas sp.]|uniref:DUF262 domain-containing protein n=1 Tax=Cellulomonas sp. TaxID=40001 RepID=UPI003BAA6A01
MQAIPSTYQEIVRLNRRLVVPLYQRHYRWGPKQFAALIDDVLRQYKGVQQYQALSEEEQAKLVGSHYMGAVVLRQSEENADEWDVIDGQQRLTTVTLLLAALRDVQLPIVKPGRKSSGVAEVDAETRDLRKNFNGTYFITPPTRAGATAKPRLVPQKRDEVPFNAVVNWSDPTLKLTVAGLGLGEPSNVLPAYAYFKRVLKMSKLRAEADTDLAPHAELFPLDPELVERIAATRLMFIEVRTTSVDDANAIFESLNYKVVPLQAIDLLKNYLFMLLRSEATRLLDEWWNPSVGKVGGKEKQLGDFILNDLVSRGISTSSTALYEAKQGELRRISAADGVDGLWAELTRMRVSLDRYLEVSNPASFCKRPAVSRALLSIHDAQGSTAVPLLMYILRSAEEDGIDDAVLVKCLRLVESYLMRRFIAGLDAHNLNSYFASMLSKTFGKESGFYSSLPLYERVAAILDSSGKDWPTDDTLTEATLLGTFYGKGETSQRMLAFKRIDQEFGQNLEIVYSESAIEAEHIFPQGAAAEPTGHWVEAAEASGMSVDEFQRRYLHSLANVVPLIRTENQSVGNKPFPVKIAVYSESSLKMTSAVATNFASGGIWREDQLKSRASEVAVKAMAAWPKPAVARPIAALSSELSELDGLEDYSDRAEIFELVEDTLDADGMS